MEQVIDYFESINPILAALYATLFTWGLTALGASLVFLFKTMNRAVLDGMLGFTGGVMVAASFWSLLAPGIEMSPGEGFVKVIPAAIGFLLGAAFIFGLDKILPHVHINFKETEGIKTPWHRTTLLTLAITLHNIPEGLAVGVLFGGVAAGFEGANIGGAVALALGIGLQNFPEGFAVAMPLRRQGLTRMRSFVYGQASAIFKKTRTYKDEEFFIRAGISYSRTYCSCFGCMGGPYFSAYFTIRTFFCCRGHDLCGG